MTVRLQQASLPLIIPDLPGSPVLEIQFIHHDAAALLNAYLFVALQGYGERFPNYLSSKRSSLSRIISSMDFFNSPSPTAAGGRVK